MHEWALAEAVIETVRTELGGRKNPRLRSVTLVFGELQSVDREIFLGGLQVLTRDTPFDSEAFHIITGQAMFRCRACTAEWTLEDVPGLDEVKLLTGLRVRPSTLLSSTGQRKGS